MNMDAKLCWLPFLGYQHAQADTPFAMAQAELEAGLAQLQDVHASVELAPGQGDGFEILKKDEAYLVRGGETGALYGVYHLLLSLHAGECPCTAWQQPAFPLRMLNHWDNMTGQIERGYAGNSFFYKDNKFDYDPERIRQYGRMLASIGVNAISINNVNVHAPADKLVTKELLPEVKKIADILRPYGVRLILSVDYALPVTMGLSTADPLDEEVQAFWKKQCDEIYSYVPDLCGFLVKADSEFRPGPYMYKRDHAQGANMLARALKPHGGLLIWRCFVYNCKQDWRDHSIDRPKAAYENYAYLDGQFDDNVILQVKNGPYDFQVREPVSPLFYTMEKTEKAIEFQLAQEYTGQQIDLYYMAPMWKEVMDDLRQMPRHICAVTNLGNDDNWTGHHLAQANLYAFGRMGWLGREMDGEKEARRWIALTFGSDFPEKERMLGMLMPSREIYEKYNSPLGLCWLVTPHSHYGPDPEGYEFAMWGTFHRANHEAVGIDRTEKGTGYACQYPKDMEELYSDTGRCPDKLLLFFHRLRYDFVMKDGRTLLQRIYDDHFEGAEGAEKLLEDWKNMEYCLPADIFAHSLDRFQRQLKNAYDWRDIINTYFYRFTGIADEKGRKIYD